MPVAEQQPFNPEGDYFRTWQAMRGAFANNPSAVYEPEPGTRILVGNSVATQNLSHLSKQLGEPNSVRITLVETPDDLGEPRYAYEFSVYAEDGTLMGYPDKGIYHSMPALDELEDRTEQRGFRHQTLVSGALYNLTEAVLVAPDHVHLEQFSQVARASARVEQTIPGLVAAQNRARRRERILNFISNMGRWTGSLLGLKPTEFYPPNREDPTNPAGTDR